MKKTFDLGLEESYNYYMIREAQIQTISHGNSLQKLLERTPAKMKEQIKSQALDPWNPASG